MMENRDLGDDVHNYVVKEPEQDFKLNGEGNISKTYQVKEMAARDLP